MVLNLTCLSQSLNYPELFGNDWLKATEFLKQNESWMKPMVRKYNIPYPVVCAVIFPELVRYSALRDKMEIAMLKTLYTNLGDEYADFSIGVFQVKPSFAEKILDTLPSISGGRSRSLFGIRNAGNDLHEYRAGIIRDLEEPGNEFKYVIAFFIISERLFKSSFADDTIKIKFLATAYNTGFWKTREEIESMTGCRYFNIKLFSSENYSYSDVSLCWYREYINSGKFR
jgi:hypothetical protein